MQTILRILFGILITTNLCTAAEYNFVSIKGLVEQDIGRIIISEIYKNLGITITIKPVPGKRAQQLATSGRKDGEIMRIFTYGIENTTTTRVTTPYYYLETMAFIKKNSGIVINNKEDLKKYKVIKVRGVKHTNNITQNMPMVHDLNSTKDMMKFLNAGRADVALTNTIDGLLALKNLGYTDIIPIDKPLATLELFHYIHQNHKQLISSVDTMIQKMQANGELKMIIKKSEMQVMKNRQKL